MDEPPQGASRALRWTKQALVDGRDMTLDLPKNSARYFHTVLHVREAGTVVVALAIDVPLRISLDGQEVYDSGVNDRTREAVKELRLDVQPGEHQLLVKVTGPSKSKKWRIALSSGTACRSKGSKCVAMSSRRWAPMRRLPDDLRGAMVASASRPTRSALGRRSRS